MPTSGALRGNRSTPLNLREMLSFKGTLLQPEFRRECNSDPNLAEISFKGGINFFQ